MVSSEPPSPVPCNVPMWAVSDPGESGALKTKMYAGSASAPPASFAPSPPLAWQQQPDETPFYAGAWATGGKQNNSAASAWTGTINLMTQMNSMDITDSNSYTFR